MQKYDVIIIGAGAAGMFAAATAIQNGRQVAILDMGDMPLRKVFVSGGGRCNFTNLVAGFNRYFGENPSFVRSALAQFSPHDMLDWANVHKIRTVQKAPGQYFCVDGAGAVIDALTNDARQAKIYMNTIVELATKNSDGFVICASGKTFVSDSLIVATGGMSYANMGVSDVGYKIAKSVGHKVVPVRPALCGIATNSIPSDLAGIAMPVRITVGRESFDDDLLFTHYGLGGPAIYRATVRNITDGIHICLLNNAIDILRDEKIKNPRRNLATCLSAYMPARIARWISGNPDKNMAEFSDKELKEYANKISDVFIPSDQFKLHNMRTAEVVRGGVSTDQISSKTMESKLCPGLFFAGEVMDIAGDLGGFNLQWAWASGYVAGKNA